MRAALVLTVFECKGLEFDDVFLFNFFEDSPAAAEWRVVTHYLEREGQRLGMSRDAEPLRTAAQKSAPRPLKFDERTHAILSEEWKQLYTAITRARRCVLYRQRWAIVYNGAAGDIIVPHRALV